MISRKWFINYDLDNVKMFVDRALSVDDKYVRIASGEVEKEIVKDDLKTEFEKDEFDDDSYDPAYAEYERATDVLLAYQDIVVRAALNEINSIVEYEIKLLASFSLSQKLNKSLKECWQRDREKAGKAIEKNHNIKLANLPSYTDVEEVRKIINAYKHDDGYSKDEYEPFAGKFAEIQKKYKLDPDNILRYINSAKKFLIALPDMGIEMGEDMSKRLKINSRSGSSNS